MMPGVQKGLQAQLLQIAERAPDPERRDPVFMRCHVCPALAPARLFFGVAGEGCPSDACLANTVVPRTQSWPPPRVSRAAVLC